MPLNGALQAVLGVGVADAVGEVSVKVILSVAGWQRIPAPSGSLVVTVIVSEPAAISAAENV